MSYHVDPYSHHYASLSVKDLLDARDMCHLQLSHSTNVFQPSTLTSILKLSFLEMKMRLLS